MIVATSYYSHAAAIEASGLVPLATSVGLPRWGTRYELGGQVGPLCPVGIFKKVEFGPEYERLYVARLEKFGVSAIEALLGSFAAAFGSEGVVLLCWEKDASECHRSIFARWWEEQTGQPVEELAELQLQVVV